MPYKRKNKLLAVVLALVGGVVGMHKFYLRETSGGIFFLFLFFMSVNVFGNPITALIGMFDAFRLLSMSNDAFDRKYNNTPQNSPYRRGRHRRSRTAEPAPTQRQRTTKRHNPFIKSGERYYKEFELEEAASDYEKALEIDDQNKEVLFNLAAVYSLLENKEKSMEMLGRLTRTGYDNYEKIQKHDDLAFIRIQPEFEAFKENGYKLQRQASVNAPEKEGDLLQDDLLLSQLNKLMELRKKGYLNDADFALEKKKLMQRR